MKSTLKITALAAFTLIGTASFGQSLNFSGGFTTSSLRFDGESMNGTYVEEYNGGVHTSTYETLNINGFNGAIGYEFRLGNRLSLETGFKYLSRGYRSKYTSTFVNDSYDYSEMESQSYKLNYFDLPVTLNIGITTGEFKTYARTGIYAGLMTGMKYTSVSEYRNSDGDSYYSEYEERSSDLDMDERLTGGLQFGVGAEYKGFYFETNYNVGALMLTDIDFNAFTHDLSFSLGYKLKFNK